MADNYLERQRELYEATQGRMGKSQETWKKENKTNHQTSANRR